MHKVFMLGSQHRVLRIGWSWLENYAKARMFDRMMELGKFGGNNKLYGCEGYHELQES